MNDRNTDRLLSDIAASPDPPGPERLVAGYVDRTPYAVQPAHTPSRIDVIDAMIDYGGGFVKHLAQAWMRADDDNDRRLREAFPHYWEQYTQAAARRLAREAERLAKAKGGAA